jgi:hypothetical protein
VNHPRSPFVPWAAARLGACLLVLFAALASCRTTPLPQDLATLSAPKLAQAAQSAADKGSYQLAIEYYKAVRDRFPEEIQRGLWASYEIAFLTHKTGKNEEAILLFDELIQSYVDRNDAKLPQGPLILAKKVRANLIENRLPAADPTKGKEAPAPAPPSAAGG